MHHNLLTVPTLAAEQMVEITRDVAALVAGWGVRDGLVHVFSVHTTCGITINENADPDVQTDMLDWLARLVPHEAPFRHYEGNSDAHLKTTLVGTSASVPLVEGRLVLGRWQGIYLCEFDGPRQRQVAVSFIGA